MEKEMEREIDKEMDKKFIEVPKNDFDKIIMVANMATQISGKPTSKEEILQSIEERDLMISKEQLEYIKENFS